MGNKKKRKLKEDISCQLELPPPSSSSCLDLFISIRPVILLPSCFPIRPFPPWCTLKSRNHDLLDSAPLVIAGIFSPFPVHASSSTCRWFVIEEGDCPPRERWRPSDWGSLGEGTGRRRRKLINQPNENIPTDTKTSYGPIKTVRGVWGWGMRRWKKEVRDCGSETVGGYKSRNKEWSDNLRDFDGHAG